LIQNYLQNAGEDKWENGSVHTYIQGIVASKVCYFVELSKIYEEAVERHMQLLA